MHKIEIKQLEYFLTVAEYLSFTRSAEALHVAQPAISQQIKQLERDLGITLFNRDNKRVHLTEAGKLFKEYALKVLNELEQGIQVVEEFRGLERGTVNIGMSSTMSSMLMADLVKTFNEQFPHIKIKIIETVTSHSVNSLKNNKLDLAIISLPLPEAEDANNATMQVIELYEEQLQAIVPYDHPLIKNNITSIDLIDLNQYKWFLADHSNTLRRLINKACEEKGFSPIVRVEVDRITSVKNLLRVSQTGVSILPPTSVNYELSLGIFKKIQLKNTNITRKVGLISRPDSLLTPATRTIIEVIKELCNAYPENSYISNVNKKLSLEI